MRRKRYVAGVSVGIMKNVLSQYFADKNYALLYGQNAFRGAAFLTMGLFIAGWLYELGVGLHWIVLYQAANFTLMGLLSPLGAYMANRYGLTKTFALSSIAYFFSLLFLSYAHDSVLFILLGLLFSGLANGLSNPPDMVMQAVYVQNENRGRVFSIVNYISTFMTFVSLLVSGWLADSFGLIGISVMCTLFWVGSIVCIYHMDDRLIGSGVVDIKKCFSDVLAPENRNLLGLSFGFQFLVISSFTFVPILLYIATDSFQGVSAIAAFAILVQAVIVILHGIWVDKTPTNAPLRMAISMHSLGLIIYAFFASGKLSFLFADSLQRTGLLLFFGTLFPRVHKTLADNNIPVLQFGAVWHMGICFWELITLSLMALAIYMVGEPALKYCMLVCAFGSFFSYYFCHRLSDQAATDTRGASGQV